MKKAVIFILCISSCCTAFLLSGCSESYNINKLYQITDNGDFAYNYVVKDKNGNILISDEYISHEPKINVINNKLLSISVQTGTGISTRWMVYCDVFNGRVSDTYYSVLGEYIENVVFIDYNNGIYSVVIQNIFNKKKYHNSIVLEEASEVTEPVIDFEKINDEKARIVYLKGKEYIETEITVELK